MNARTDPKSEGEESSAPLMPNAADMRRHLDHLFGGDLGEYQDGLIELAWTDTTPDDDGRYKLRHANLFRADRLDELVKQAFNLNTNPMCNVYVGAALRHPQTAPFGRAKDKDFYALTAGYSDQDEPGSASAAKNVYQLNTPTLVVVTGAHPHTRAQFWWRLKELVADPDQARALLETMAGSLAADTSVTNPGRVMRLAGSIAWPVKDGRVPELTHIGKINNPGPATYSVEQLHHIFAPPTEPESPPTQPEDKSENKADSKADSKADGSDFFRQVNSRALQNIAAWIYSVFPSGDVSYQSGTGAYRISSKALGRKLEEDLSITPNGIVDFGVHDMGDARRGKRTAIDVVMEFGGAADVQAAALWLCDRLGIRPEDLGWNTGKWPNANKQATDNSQDEPRLKEMNERYFVFREGGKTLVGSFEEEYGRSVLQAIDFTNFKHLHQNRRIEINEIKVQLGKWWLDHPNRRQYEGVIMDPGTSNKVVRGKLNLWRGFAFEPRQGDWSLLLDHLRVVVCNGDEERLGYVLNWIAWCIQNPDKRAEVVIVLMGARGTGKGTLGNCLCRLFGQHAVHVSSAERLAGRFNGHLRDTILLFADEAYWPGNKSAEGELKRLITEPTLLIENKGRDTVSVRNMLHVIMASNEDWVVPAGERERRYFVLEVNDLHIQDREWFGPIYDQLDNGGYEAMLHDMLNRELGDWHPRNIPHNKNNLLSQQAESLSPFDSWWIELLESGSLPACDPNTPSRAVSGDYVVTEGLSVRTREGLLTHARKSSPKLRQLSDHLLGAFLIKQGADNTRKVKRRRGWTFPALQECRKAWGARFPGWKWRDPNLSEWQAPLECDDDEQQGSDHEKT